MSPTDYNDCSSDEQLALLEKAHADIEAITSDQHTSRKDKYLDKLTKRFYRLLFDYVADVERRATKASLKMMAKEKAYTDRIAAEEAAAEQGDKEPVDKPTEKKPAAHKMTTPEREAAAKKKANAKKKKAKRRAAARKRAAQQKALGDESETESVPLQLPEVDDNAKHFAAQLDDEDDELRETVPDTFWAGRTHTMGWWKGRPVRVTFRTDEFRDAELGKGWRELVSVKERAFKTLHIMELLQTMNPGWDDKYALDNAVQFELLAYSSGLDRRDYLTESMIKRVQVQREGGFW